MTKDLLFLLKTFSWSITTLICLVYALNGYSSTPTFDKWFWGICFGINAVVFLVALFAVLVVEA